MMKTWTTIMFVARLAKPSSWMRWARVPRHPAVGAKRHLPHGPDDDPEFLRQLDRRIRGTSADPGELRTVTSQRSCRRTS